MGQRGRGRGTNCVSHLCRHGIGLPTHPDLSSFLQFYNRTRENTPVAAKDGQGIAFHISGGQSGDRGPSTMGLRAKANHGWPFARAGKEARCHPRNVGCTDSWRHAYSQKTLTSRQSIFLESCVCKQWKKKTAGEKSIALQPETLD